MTEPCVSRNLVAREDMERPPANVSFYLNTIYVIHVKIWVHRALLGMHDTAVVTVHLADAPMNAVLLIHAAGRMIVVALLSMEAVLIVLDLVRDLEADLEIEAIQTEDTDLGTHMTRIYCKWS